MATVPNTSTIINVAIITQYLAVADIRSRKFSANQIPNKKLPKLLYTLRRSIQWAYGVNPNDSALTKTGEYLYALCGPYSQTALNILGNVGQASPVVTGPSNQSVTLGQNATFTISVTSSLPYTIQWYLNGVVILGATGLSYTKTNAQLTDSGGEYSAVVTSTAGATSSSNGLLTVTQIIQAFWWYGSSDPYPALNGGSDSLTYEITQNITHNAAIVITYPLASQNNQFTVLKYPATENDKATWVNDPLNQGSIPDAIMRGIFTLNGFKYIVSRVAMSLDSTATTLTYQ